MDLSIYKYNNKKKCYKNDLIKKLNYNEVNNRKEVTLTLEKKGNVELFFIVTNNKFKGYSYFVPKIIQNFGKNNINLLLNITYDNNQKIITRYNIIEQAGNFENKRILNNLYQLLKDENIYCRKSAILALAVIRDHSSVDIIFNLFNKEDDWIKQDTREILRKLGDNHYVAKIINLLSKRNKRFKIKRNICVILSRIAQKRAVKILTRILRHHHSSLKYYLYLALEELFDKRKLHPIIKLRLNPTWNSKDFYKGTFNSFVCDCKSLLKDYDYKIRRREELPPNFYEDIRNPGDWHYGYMNKSHYILNSFNEIIGCLNLIHFSTYNNTHLFYFDTLEIKKDYRHRGLGTELVQFMIKYDVETYDRYNIFLLVANCDQYKLKFFSKLGFSPVNLRNTKIGTHCVMSYPYDDNSEKNCHKLFEYFNWREEKKEFISSDCKYAYNPNPTGLYWCDKKKIYVTGLEKQICQFYIKEKEFYFEGKFLDLKEK